METTNFVIQTYKEYYIDRDYEQTDLFHLIKNKFNVAKVIYPGSYVHISPSFIFSDTTFIDSDRKAKKFFGHDKLYDFINNRKKYEGEPSISFHGTDYRKKIDGLTNQFDLLISQYAGFISDTCKDYLKVGGYLLVNNSHGDAGLASIDNDYKFVAAVHKSNGKYRITEGSLEKYFIPKSETPVTKELLYKTQKGVGYTKTAPLYIFELISKTEYKRSSHE